MIKLKPIVQAEEAVGCEKTDSFEGSAVSCELGLKETNSPTGDTQNKESIW